VKASATIGHSRSWGRALPPKVTFVTSPALAIRLYFPQKLDVSVVFTIIKKLRGKNYMETRYYETQEINIPPIAQALVVEYLAQGYKAQQFGDVNQTTVQLKKDSALRTITGFDKALAISLQRVDGGVLVKVGAQDWVDQIAVGAVGLIIHPLLITAAVGAMQQNNALHDVINSIDLQIRQQQPQARAGVPSANLM